MCDAEERCKKMEIVIEQQHELIKKLKEQLNSLKNDVLQPYLSNILIIDNAEEKYILQLKRIGDSQFHFFKSKQNDDIYPIGYQIKNGSAHIVKFSGSLGEYYIYGIDYCYFIQTKKEGERIFQIPSPSDILKSNDQNINKKIE